MISIFINLYRLFVVRTVTDFWICRFKWVGVWEESPTLITLNIHNIAWDSLGVQRGLNFQGSSK